MSAVDSERFALCEVVHRFDTERGYVCEVSSRPPSTPRRPWGMVAGHGVVVDIEDPDDMGRVRVRLPAYDDLESAWVPVAVPAAGPNKGLLALPDVGDRVLILFSREDLAHGIVIGGLYGGEPLPGPGGVQQNDRRSYTLRTAGGQFVHLDDVEHRLRCEVEGGSFVELAPDKMHLHAQSDLVIEAPGRRITIRADTVDFTRG